MYPLLNKLFGHFEVSSIDNEVILIIIKQNKQKNTQFLTNNHQRKQ